MLFSIYLGEGAFAAQPVCPNLTGEYECDGTVQEYYSGTTVEISQKGVGKFVEYTLPPSDSRSDVDVILTDGKSHITGSDSMGGMQIELSYRASCAGQVLSINRYASGIEVSRDTQLYIGSGGELIVTDVMSQGTAEKTSSSKCFRIR